MDYKPVIVDDIKSSFLYENKEGSFYCIGSLSRDKYLKVPEDVLEYIMIFIKYLDGNNTLEQIKIKLMTEEKIDLDVDILFEELEKADLIVNNRNENEVEKGEFDKFFLKLINIPIGKYCKNLDKLNRSYVKRAFYVSEAIIIFSILIMVFNWSNFTTLENYFIHKSVGISVLISFPVLLFSIVLHECAHGVVASYYGLKPSNFVFGFYATFSGMFYLKIPGIYTLKKKEKIVLWCAGIYTNLIIGALAIMISAISSGTILIIANLCVVINLSLILCNISPLLPLDGYYLLSTIINQPNLRKNSFGMLKGIILNRKKVKFSLLYIIYFLLSFGFMATIFFLQIKYIIIWFVQQMNIYGSLIDIILNSKVIIIILMICFVRICIIVAKKLHFLRLNKNTVLSKKGE